VPASAANLGPGFDALGLALAIHDEIDVELRDDEGVEVDVVGEGAGEVPTDERHLVVRALRLAAEALGFPIGGLRLRCVNRIPHARGLGSSAAATVAGVAAAYRLAGRSPDESALNLAVTFEGHADNAAAAMFGGLVLTWRDDTGFRVAGPIAHPGLVPVVYVPDVRSSTIVTRGLLPVEVPHGDAAFNVGRAALAVHALTVAPELLFAATEDRLHQRYRADALGPSTELVRRSRDSGLPAMISGAGPTVLVLPPSADAVGEVEGFTRLVPPIDRHGVLVREVAEVEPRSGPSSVR
jgi:homoserine kinase